MWPFRRKNPPPDLDERLLDLERTVKALQLEWEDTYDRLRRLMGRIAKREAIDGARKSREDAPGSTIPEGPEATTDDMASRIRQRLRGA